MFRFLTDHDLNEAIARQPEQKASDVDIVRAREVGLSRSDDRELLAFAATENCIILSHDRTTMTGFAYERTLSGQVMPGLLVIRQTASIGEVVDDLYRLPGRIRFERVVLTPPQ
jgi:predicted nuclease of predicted toxin-antitoxin system